MPRATTYELQQLSRGDLEREVLRLRAGERTGRLRDIERCQARVAKLELRDQERAREILKSRAAVAAAVRLADEQIRLREHAEREARRFHALMIQARVRAIAAKGRA